MKDNKWFQYVIFSDNKRTYVGSTVNLNRRIRQHNREIKGGAKATKYGKWEYYSVVYNINNYKNMCLSEEWHVKYFSARKVKKSKNVFDKKKQALELYYKSRPHYHEPYDYVMFISKKYSKEYLPMIDKRIFTFIVDDFSMDNIINLMNSLTLISKY